MSQNNNNVSAQVLLVIHQFIIETGHLRLAHTIDDSSTIERDLGIDSLGRVELFHRLEEAFAIRIAAEQMAAAETVQDIITLVSHAKPSMTDLPKKISPEKLDHIQFIPEHANTLTEVLKHYAEKVPERPHIYLQAEDFSEEILTYGNIYKEALRIAHGLIASGIKQQDTIAIMMPTCKEFFYIFYGILLTGAIPVPIYPPFRANKLVEYAKREIQILKNAQARMLITFEEAERLSRLLKNFIPSLLKVATYQDLLDDKTSPLNLHINEYDLALIQYTSGSTGIPKGVALSHANLLANIRAFGKGAEIKPTDVGFSWLPLYHDMGLIGACLGSLYYGAPLALMSPIIFIMHPERWLWGIHYHRATISAGPNFAYELCIRKIDDRLIQGLDLSSWRIAFNGAEAINPDTLKRFAKKFAPYGFRSTTLFPVYGLAESTVALTMPSLNKELHIDLVERETFETKNLAIPAQSNNTDVLQFVSCGKALANHAVRIVDSNGHLLSERQVGHLQFTGPSSMRGYYQNPEATQKVYHEGWWDSGDLAYLVNEEVFIAGRKKDVIIKAGRNMYPEGIETIVSEINGVRRGCVVAFGIFSSQKGTEDLIIIAETSLDKNLHDELKDKITETVSDQMGIAPDKVILIEPQTMPKTSSGKLQRSTVKNLYLTNELTLKTEHKWKQISQLASMTIWKKIKTGIKNIGKFFYGIYVAIILILILLPTWILLLICSKKIGFKIQKYFPRILFTLIGDRITIKGKENLPLKENVIYVVNHTSYADVPALLAALPEGVIFTAKKELLKTPMIKTYIEKLDHLTVNRTDVVDSIEDIRNIAQAIKNKKSIVFFPEGTFAYATGLRPFKMGAFKLAVEENIPICPIALKGLRSILRSGQKIPKPGKIEITILPLIYPQNITWQEAIRLRDHTRMEIAKCCGEYPIDLVGAAVEKQ
jgi:acyl carrier protein